MGCGKSEQNISEAVVHSLSAAEDRAVQNAISPKPSIISGYTCSFCRKTNGKCRLETYFVNAPRILALYLMESDDRIFNNPEVYIYSGSSDSAKKTTGYKLLAAVRYNGDKVSGHYFATVKYGSAWYFVNDAEIKPIIKTESVYGSPAFILFYEEMI